MNEIAGADLDAMEDDYYEEIRAMEMVESVNYLDIPSKRPMITSPVSYKSSLRTTLCDIMCTVNTSINFGVPRPLDSIKPLMASLPYKGHSNLHTKVKKPTLYQSLKVGEHRKALDDELRWEREQYMRELEREKEEILQRKTAAAIKIQALFRGCRSRKQRPYGYEPKRKKKHTFTQNFMQDELCKMAVNLGLKPINGLSLEARSKANKRRDRIHHAAAFRLQRFFKMISAKAAAKRSIHNRWMQIIDTSARRITRAVRYVKVKNFVKQCDKVKRERMALKIQCRTRMFLAREKVRRQKKNHFERTRRNEAAIIIQRNCAPKQREVDFARVTMITLRHFFQLVDHVVKDTADAILNDGINEAVTYYAKYTSDLIERASEAALERCVEAELTQHVGAVATQWIEEQMSAILAAHQRLVEEAFMLNTSISELAMQVDAGQDQWVSSRALLESDEFYDALAVSSRTGTPSTRPTRKRSFQEELVALAAVASAVMLSPPASRLATPAVADDSLLNPLDGVEQQQLQQQTELAAAGPADLSEAQKLLTAVESKEELSAAIAEVKAEETVSGGEAADVTEAPFIFDEFIAALVRAIIDEAVALNAPDPLTLAAAAVAVVVENEEEEVAAAAERQRAVQQAAADVAANSISEVVGGILAEETIAAAEPRIADAEIAAATDKLAVEIEQSAIASTTATDIADDQETGEYDDDDYEDDDEEDDDEDLDESAADSSQQQTDDATEAEQSAAGVDSVISAMTEDRIFEEWEIAREFSSVSLTAAERAEIEDLLKEALQQHSAAAFDAALKTLEKFIPVLRKFPSSDNFHPDVARLHSTIKLLRGRVLFAQAKYPEAKLIFDSVSQQRLEVFSKSHFLSAEVSYFIGQWHRAMAQYNDADKFLAQSAMITAAIIRALGQEKYPQRSDCKLWNLHNRTLIAQAELMKNQGQYFRANSLLLTVQQSLSLCKKHGIGSVEIQGEFVCCTVSLLMLKGKYSAARQLHEDLLRRRRAFYSIDLPTEATVATAETATADGDTAATAETPAGDAVAAEETAADTSATLATATVEGSNSNGSTSSIATTSAAAAARHPKIATSLCFLGCLKLLRCEYVDAAHMLEESLQMRREFYPADHPAISVSLYWKAVAFAALGRVDEALLDMSDSLTLRRLKLGEAHPGVAHSLLGLARIRTQQGSPLLAWDALTAALAAYRACYGSDKHRDVAQCAFDMGCNAESRDSFLEAMAYHEQALHLREQLLPVLGCEAGDIHLAVETSKIHLARVYGQLSRFDEAKKLMKSAVKNVTKVLGNNNVLVAESLSFLGELCKSRGNCSDAKTLFALAFNIVQQLYGNQHPQVARLMCMSADNLRLPGHFQEATELAVSATDIFSSLYGAENLHTATAVLCQAQILRDCGRVEEAEQHYCESLQVLLRSAGEPSGTYAVALSELGECYRLQGKYELSEKALNTAIDIQKAMFGDEALAVHQTLCSFCLLLIDEKKPEEAAQVLRHSVLPTFDRVLGANHPTTCYARANLALAGQLVHYMHAAEEDDASVILSSMLQHADIAAFIVVCQQCGFAPEHPWLLRFTESSSSHSFARTHSTSGSNDGSGNGSGVDADEDNSTLQSGDDSYRAHNNSNMINFSSNSNINNNTSSIRSGVAGISSSIVLRPQQEQQQPTAEEISLGSVHSKAALTESAKSPTDSQTQQQLQHSTAAAAAVEVQLQQLSPTSRGESRRTADESEADLATATASDAASQSQQQSQQPSQRSHRGSGRRRSSLDTNSRGRDDISGSGDGGSASYSRENDNSISYADGDDSYSNNSNSYSNSNSYWDDESQQSQSRSTRYTRADDYSVEESIAAASIASVASVASVAAVAVTATAPTGQRTGRISPRSPRSSSSSFESTAGADKQLRNFESSSQQPQHQQQRSNNNNSISNDSISANQSVDDISEVFLDQSQQQEEISEKSPRSINDLY